MISRRTILLAAAAFGCAASPALADDAGLYGAPPPPDAAFVRVIDARGVGAIAVSVGSIGVAVPAGGVSGYAVAPAGPLKVVAGGAESDLTIEAGKFYTLVVNGEGGAPPALIADPAIANPSKSGLYLYNLRAGSPATLFAPRQNVAVIENVTPNGGGFREINAVTLDLDVKAGGERLGGVEGLKLQRRGGHSVVVFADGRVGHVANSVLP
jgi:hypothetical protein